MASIDDKQLAVARVYARSLLELAAEGGAEEETLEEIEGILALAAADAEVGHFLANPLIEPARRAESLEKLFRGRLSDLSLDALQVINRKGRLELLPAIAAAYRAELRERQGLVEVAVTSAVPLPEALRRQLQKALDEYTGRRAEMVETVDPEILGGLVVRVGDDKIDTSVARELGMLSAAFAERASREILGGKAYVAE